MKQKISLSRRCPTACRIWHPHTNDGSEKIECVQRRAAIFVCVDNSQRSSVSAMISQLNWDSLLAQKKYSKDIMMYMIVYRLVAIPAKLLRMLTLTGQFQAMSTSTE